VCVCVCTITHTHTHAQTYKLILGLSLSNLFKMLIHRYNLSFSPSSSPIFYCISTIAQLSLKRVKLLIPLRSPALLIFSSRAEFGPNVHVCTCMCVCVCGYPLAPKWIPIGFQCTLISASDQNHRYEHI